MARAGYSLTSIQVLRGLAALAVVVVHVFEDLDRRFSLPASYNLLNSGVDLFFVISGFVMVHATESRKPTAGRFFLDRLVRIVPLYWLALLAMIGMLALAGRDLPGLWEQVQAYLFIPYADPVTGDMWPFLPVGWTLSYEMAFYLLFAGAIALGLNGWWRIGAITAVFVVMAGARVLAPGDGALVFRLTSPLFFEFSFGMVLAMILPWLRRAPALTGLGLMAAAIALVLALHPLHMAGSAPRFLAYGVPAALLLAGALMAERCFATAPMAPLRRLGDASYSLYLVHPLPLVVLWAMMPLDSYWGDVLALTALCVVLGLLLHHLVEAPLLALLRRVTRRKPAAVAPAGGLPTT